MWTTFPILHSLQQHWYHVIHIQTIYNYQILHEKTIGRVPSAVQHPWLRIQQIFDLLIVYLCETGLDRVVLFALSNFFPQLLDSPRDNPLPLILLINLTIENLLLTSHGISFPWSCLPISKDSGTITLNSSLNKLSNIRSLITLTLTFISQHLIKLITLLCPSKMLTIILLRYY